MTRSLSIVAAFALGFGAACGGGQSAVPNTPLPPDNAVAAGSGSGSASVAATKPEPPPAPPAPPEPQGFDLPVAAVPATVKLTKAGAGKKSALKLALAAGAKQHVELAFSFADKENAPPELGGPKDEAAPTLVLVGDIAVGEVAADGAAKFTLAIATVDGRDRPGSKPPVAEFRGLMAGLTGLVITGSVAANGQLGDLQLHLDKADDAAKGAMALVKIFLRPLWPQLPAEPIGVGATWTATNAFKIADQVDAIATTDYQLAGHKGSTWEIKAKVKVAGTDHNLTPTTKVGKISGSGALTMSLGDNAVVPVSTQSLISDFTMVGTPPGAANGPNQEKQATIHLEQQLEVK